MITFKLPNPKDLLDPAKKLLGVPDNEPLPQETKPVFSSKSIPAVTFKAPTSKPQGPISFNPPKKMLEPFDATNAGILFNTIVGLPQAAKEVIFPTRGFEEEEIKKAEPSLKQKTVAIPKIGAEISSGFGDLVTLIPGYQTLANKILSKNAGQKLADIGMKIQEFGKPKTVEEAAAMRFADAVTLFIGELRIGATAAQTIARSKNAAKISEIILGEVKTINKQQADELARLLVHVDNADDVQTLLYRVNSVKRNANLPAVVQEGAAQTTPAITFKLPGEAKPSPTLPEKPKFEGFTDITSNVLDKLKGRGVVAKQFISDLTNSPDLKQAERDLVRDVLNDYPEGNIPVAEFANKVRGELLPLKTDSGNQKRYESVTLPSELRGPVANYDERIYESPVETSAGTVHFDREIANNYFAHSRIEDLPAEGSGTRKVIDGKTVSGKKDATGNFVADTGGTRRVIELQSDLFQKGRLEGEAPRGGIAEERAIAENARSNMRSYREGSLPYKEEVKRLAEAEERIKIYESGKLPPKKQARITELSKLEPYRNTWHERVIREEVKQAAIDGKTKLQFPTGETAMKIEGLGDTQTWDVFTNENQTARAKLTSENIKVGKTVIDKNGDYWLVAEDLGDGKFKAVSKEYLTDLIAEHPKDTELKYLIEEANRSGDLESFDISGKVDTNNPIYKFYEKEVGRYLSNKYGAKRVKDSQGVEWWEIPVNKEAAKAPVQAFKKGEKFTPNITRKEATEIVTNLFSEKELEIVFDVRLLENGYLGLFRSAGTGPFGEWLKPTIEFMEKGGMVDDRVVYHELFHAYFNTYLTAAERKTMIEKVKKNFLTISRVAKTEYKTANERAEEWLADDFAEYARTKKSKGGFNSIWEKLLNKLRDLIRRTEKFQKIYDDILSGRKKPGEKAEVKRAMKSDEDPGEMRSDKTETEKGIKEIKKLDEKESKTNKLPSDAETRYEVAKITKEGLSDILKMHPGRKLAMYANQNGELPEVLGKGEGKFGRSGDEFAEELGYEDSEAARADYQNYRALQRRFSESVTEFREAQLARRRERITGEDEKSLGRLLDKGAKLNEAEVARRDRAVRIMKQIDARDAELREEQARLLSYKEKVQRARMNAEKKENIIKKTWHALFPIKGLKDDQTKELTLDWFGERYVAKAAANEIAVDLAKRGPQTMEEIIAFESGKPVKYIRESLDELGTRAQREGMEFEWRPNYVPHVYEQTREEVMAAIAKYLKKEKGMSEEDILNYMNGGELPKDKSLRLKLNPYFVKERVFPTYSMAIKYGLMPKFRSPAKLIAHYQQELETTLANRRYLAKLQSEAKLLPFEDAPDTWVPVSKMFSKDLLYAEPSLARMINGQFRDEENLDLVAHAVKILSGISRFMQEIKLSAGVPFTNINYFSTGQAVRILTSAIGETAKGDFRNALSSLKSSFSYIRANSNKASAKWFYEKRGIITRMAAEGIDISGRTGNFEYEGLKEQMSRALETFKNEFGFGIGHSLTALKAPAKVLFDKAFNEKTFGNMMPMVAVQTFEDAYNMAIKQGLPEDLASKFAAQTTRNFTGIAPVSGRGQTTQDTLAAGFFAPKFREGIINIFYNSLISLAPQNIRNPAFAKNRGLLLGMLITYGLYQYLNQKINDQYTWENPPGREFAIRLPLPNEQVGYIEFMPSTLAFIRNMISGGIATSKGDFGTATQKFGTIFSMPLKLTTEVLSNSDYFGREIYKEDDEMGDKLKKIAAYVGLGTSHPWITETWRYAKGDQPLYQSLLYMAEAPLKFSNLTKEQNSAYYKMLDEQKEKRKDLKEKVRPVYEKNQELKAAGKTAEADEIYWNLSEDDRVIYNQIKADEKRSATLKRKPAIQKIYNDLQALKAGGRLDEATEAYWNLSPEDRKIYDSIKRTAESLE